MLPTHLHERLCERRHNGYDNRGRDCAGRDLTRLEKPRAPAESVTLTIAGQAALSLDNPVRLSETQFGFTLISLPGQSVRFDNIVIPVPRGLADFDHDGDVDQEDFGHFQACLSGSGQSHLPECTDSDFDVKLIDAIGRPWQLSTVQFDFTLPKRFDLSFIGPDGQAHQPVMLHRAIVGSMERFIGILIEHYAGSFPLWLAPVQAVVTTITSEADEYAKQVVEAARRAGLRVEIDLRNEKINYKVREHSLQKIPALLVVSMRGDPGEWNWAQVPMGRAVRPILDALGVQHLPVETPGTAKNVITVGAIEQLRNITNDVWKCPPVATTNNPCSTNQPWLRTTDSSDQVAAFSSRGPTDDGRIKPEETTVLCITGNGLKTPDAIHAASAICQGATGFICHDRAFTKIREMDCLVL